MSAWLRSILTPDLVVGVSVLSAILFFGSLALVPWLVTRLPADYFSDKRLPTARDTRVWMRVAKNAVGVILFAMGVAMLLLPGQGVLTLLVAMVLLDFPGKRRLERRLAKSPRLLSMMNRLRRRAGREPLSID